jgi:hypothetical protein
MLFSMAGHLSRVVPPTLNGSDDLGEELENLPPGSRRAPIEQRLEMGQKRVVGVVIERPPLRGELDVQAPPVVRVIDAFDQPFFFELIDDAGHRTDPNAEIGRQFPHRAWPMEVQNPHAVRLRDGERPIQPIVQAPELIELGQVVQGFVQREQVGGEGHRPQYYDSRTIRIK